MGMSFAFGVTPDKQDMISLLHAAVDRGITFLTPQKPMGLLQTKNCWARHWLRIEIKW